MNRSHVEIDPKLGYCHPPQSKRTKCACGATVHLVRVSSVSGTSKTRCRCGRVHVKEQGASAFRRYNGIDREKRPGGSAGCPGVYLAAPLSETQRNNGEE